MFILSTYIDGPRWESGLEPLLYPTGVSFYRPFSYRREYFQPEQVADQLTDPSQRRSLLHTTWNDGFFGLRFRDAAYPDFLPLFVPLRKVTVLDVEASDQINISFKLGPYVSPMLVSADGKDHALPRLELGGLLTNPAEPKFLIVLRDSEKAITSGWNVREDFPPGMWEALEKTVSPAARPAIFNTVLLRLMRLRQRGKTEALTPIEIDSTSHIWGFRLQENRAYDVLFTYFRIRQPGTEPPPIEHQFCLTNPSEEIQASRRFVLVNANYRNEEIWISPKMAGVGPVQIAFEPCRLGDTKVVDQRASKTIGLKFPVLVEPQQWPKKRKVDFLIGLLCFGVTAWLWWKYQFSSEATQKALLVLIAVLASVGITSIKDALMFKR